MIEIGLQSTIRYPFFLSPDLHCRSLYPEDPSGRSGVLNILIEVRDGIPEPCLTDFGIGNIHSAKKLEELGITQSGFTESLFVRSTQRSDSGTRLYSAPEYLVGGQPTIKGDIYALGIILYQLMAEDLKKPLGSGWRRDIADSLIAEDIAGCVDVDPSRRYESAVELADRLDCLEKRRTDASRLAAIGKRHRLYKLAGITAAVVAMALVYGYFQSRESEKLARETMGRTEGLLEYLLRDLHEKLQEIGRLGLMNSVVDEVQTYYDNLPPELETDDTRLRHSVVLGQLAIIKRDLGDISQARDLLVEITGLRRQLVERNPGKLDWRNELADVLDALGVIQSRLGDPNAEESYREAAAIREALIDEDPNNNDYINGLANVYNNLAAMQKNRGELTLASENFRQAIELREQLIERDSENTRWRYIQSWGLNNFGWFHLRKGSLQDAQDAFRQSQDYIRKLLEFDPDSNSYQLSLATSALGLGDVATLTSSQDYREAEGHLQSAVSLYSELVRSDQENANWRWRLSDAFRSQGRLEFYLGNLQSARHAYQQALEISEQLAAEDPVNMRLQWQLADALAGTARAALEMAAREGRTPSNDAVAGAKRAVSIGSRLVDTDSDNTTWLLTAGVAHAVLARTYELQKEHATSRAQYEKAIETFETREGKGTGSVEGRLEHIESLCRFANALRGRDAVASEAYFVRAEESLVQLGVIRQSDWYRRLSQVVAARSQPDWPGVSAILFSKSL